MVTGDFDLSGDRHRHACRGGPGLRLRPPDDGARGSCRFPMMTGYIHTVYPRASVSMKLSSPLKVGRRPRHRRQRPAIAGRVGPKPDMMPMTVKVKTGRYAETRTYKVEIVREPNDARLASLWPCLTNAVDTEGESPRRVDRARQGHDFTS